MGKLSSRKRAHLRLYALYVAVQLKTYLIVATGEDFNMYERRGFANSKNTISSIAVVDKMMPMSTG
jgi:hypothetical protein